MVTWNRANTRILNDLVLIPSLLSFILDAAFHILARGAVFCCRNIGKP